MQGSGGSQRGLTLLEFTLIFVIVSVLLVVAAERIIALRVELERAAIERTLGAMRSALSLEFAERVVTGGAERARALEGSNPFRYLDKQPAVPGGDASEVGPGRWAYSDEKGHIVYVPAYPEALTGEADTVGRWRVVVTGDERPTGVRLEPVAPLFDATGQDD